MGLNASTKPKCHRWWWIWTPCSSSAWNALWQSYRPSLMWPVHYTSAFWSLRLRFFAWNCIFPNDVTKQVLTKACSFRVTEPFLHRSTKRTLAWNNLNFMFGVGVLVFAYFKQNTESELAFSIHRASPSFVFNRSNRIFRKYSYKLFDSLDVRANRKNVMTRIFGILVLFVQIFSPLQLANQSRLTKVDNSVVEQADVVCVVEVFGERSDLLKNSTELRSSKDE